MNTIQFTSKSKNLRLNFGESYEVKANSCYRDNPEEILLEIVKEIKLGKYWKDSVKAFFANNNPWLNEIILSPKRINFIKEFINPNGQTILDIGAGLGQFSIPLAKGNAVCSLEPTSERLSFIKAVAEQENVESKIFFIGADYLNINFETKFDLILSIGVLEWVGMFNKQDSPVESVQLEFLKKISSDLSKDGKLVVGIENRLGLKYLFGSNDDHTGLPNISCLTKDLAKEKYKQATGKDLRCLTHSLHEYRELLIKAGFTKIDFYTALPDYKLPSKIFKITNNNNSCAVNDFFSNGGHCEEHDGSNGETLNNQNELFSHYKSLAKLGIAHNFVPSFYIVAS